jgi:hypothetical protein
VEQKIFPGLFTAGPAADNNSETRNARKEGALAF